MLEQLAGIEKMTIHQCEELAKQFTQPGSPKLEFQLCGPKGQKRCEWLDPFLGMFRMDGSDGFVMVKQFAFVQDLWCEGLKPIEEERE